MRKKEHMLKETENFLCVFIEIIEKKNVIWDAGIAVFAVPTLFCTSNTALTLFVLIAVYSTLSFCCGHRL